MNLYYELVFLGAKIAMVCVTLSTCWGLGMVFHDRYVNGNVDAFKPERRVGLHDRRAGVAGR